MAAAPPNNDSIQAVIFDCDGTLVDSEVISLKVLVDLVEKEGLTIPHQEAVDAWSGCDLADVFAEVERRMAKKLPVDFLDTFRKHQLQQLEANVQPIPGAAALLQAIRFPFCVASNAPQYKIRLCLESTGLLPFVDSQQIYSAYDVNAWKPRPDLFLHAAECLGVKPKHCAVVEDSAVGLDAGLAAGMNVFGFDPHGKLPHRPGVQVVGCLSELLSTFS